MNYEIEFSIQAEADLRGIYEYIAFILLAPENMKKGIITVIRIIYEGRNMDSELLEHTKL